MNIAESSTGTATLAQCERTDDAVGGRVRMIAARASSESPRLDARCCCRTRPHGRAARFLRSPSGGAA